jgi:outer membrane lipoprotein SlyB
MTRKATLLLAITLLFTACENKAGTGALVGAGGGALVGGAISGSAGGVLIGAAAGAVGGDIMGAALFSSDRDSLKRKKPRTIKKIDRGEELSISDIKSMSKAGISDQVIISQIDATNSVFYLSTADIIDLKKAGVSQRIINYMIQTGNE